MAKNTTFMIVTGASVVVVRDGKRKPIQAGSGTDFTDDEIATIKRATPGALRLPVNEGQGRAAEPDDDDEDGDDGDDGVATTTTTEAAPTKPKGKKAKAAKPAKPAGDDADDDI